MKIAVPLINLVLVFSSPLFLGFATAQQPPGAPSSADTAHAFRVSLSVSPFTELMLKAGIVYTDGTTEARTPEELQRLYMKFGANEVYARIATSRKATRGLGDHSLDMGLARARMAHALNLPFNPEIGIFKDYGDVRCQPSPDFSDYPELKVPGAWTSLTLDQMLPILHSYGAIVARTILDTGVKVRIWDLGNEVDFGMAGVAVRPIPGQCNDYTGGPGWYKAPDNIDPEIGKMSVPDLMKMPEPARIAWLQAHVWPYEARMFAAVAAGIRSVDPEARFSTHVSGVTAVLPNQAVAFYQAMQQGGFLPDELGFSFYPAGSNMPPDRMGAFKQTVTAVHDALHRPVFIAEFGYPAGTVRVGEWSSWNNSLKQYPPTAQGQADMLRDLTAWGLSHGLSGIRPWAPGLTVPAWAPFALFEQKGKTAVARPGLGAIAEGLRSQK
jgi:hypothetical protein